MIVATTARMHATARTGAIQKCQTTASMTVSVDGPSAQPAARRPSAITGHRFSSVPLEPPPPYERHPPRPS